jgi:quinol---cytochrome-c reductase cytochrome c subunit
VKSGLGTLAAAAVALALLGVAATPGGPVQRGDALYGEYCLSCHRGNGAGAAAPTTIGAGPQRNQEQQQAVAPSLRGVGALAADFYLRTGYMPLHKVGLQPHRTRVLFTNAQIRALVAYVASLGKGPAIPTPHPQEGSLSTGMQLFTDHCAGCHQVVAQGGVVTGALPPSLEDATDVQIAEAVRIGPYVMPKFTKQVISDDQLNSIIRYVDYTKHPDDAGGWALGTIGPVPEGLVTWFIAIVVLLGLCVVIGRRLKRA